MIVSTYEYFSPVGDTDSLCIDEIYRNALEWVING